MCDSIIELQEEASATEPYLEAILPHICLNFGGNIHVSLIIPFSTLRNPCNIFIALIAFGDVLYQGSFFTTVISYILLEDHQIRQDVCAYIHIIPTFGSCFSAMLLLNLAVDRLLSLTPLYVPQLLWQDQSSDKASQGSENMKSVYRSLVVISLSIVFGNFGGMVVALTDDLANPNLSNVLLAGLLMSFGAAISFFAYYFLSSQYREVFNGLLGIDRLRNAVFSRKLTSVQHISIRSSNPSVSIEP
ncbi:hypothetical protein GCK32_015731 [Trichostrongylus colubriformis]|uniref:G-protein coupled receptors family 1 profile domain-containing protein n=1 Tax=Trichostrongylus colubriformis TaxID=6319 RepID=A0AAN8FF88_TRICO